MKNNNFMDSLFNEMARELRKEIDIESLLNEAINECMVENNKKTDVVREETVVRTIYTGSGLINAITDGKVKNCSIQVYKQEKYLFDITCGEKGILSSNENFHVGMLTSNKYTYVVTKNICNKIKIK